MLELLESRQLLAAVFYDDDSMSIKVRGTQGDDQIDVIRRGQRVLVQLNDRRRWFEFAKVKWVDIDGFAGNDRISTEYTPFRARVWAGAGNDTVIGGWGDDLIYGGDGADRLIGNAGDDDIEGGGGRDRLIGVGGRDTLIGDGGDDQMSGGKGDDYLVSRTGVDVIDGGDGADTAARFADHGVIRGIEGQTFYSPGPSPDPSTHLSVKREM